MSMKIVCNPLNDILSIPSNLKKRYLKQVFDVAYSSPSEFKVGAVLLSKKKVISFSCNYDRRTHPVQSKWATRAEMRYGEDYSKKTYLHAEIGALIKAKKDADTVVICRVGGLSGLELLNARPCKVCSGFLIESGIKHVHYSTNQGFRYEYWG